MFLWTIGAGVLKPKLNAACLFLEFHAVLDNLSEVGSTRNREAIPVANIRALDWLKQRHPTWEIFILSFLMTAQRRNYFEQSINATTGLLNIISRALTCREKLGPTCRASTIEAIGKRARSAFGTIRRTFVTALSALESRLSTCA